MDEYAVRWMELKRRNNQALFVFIGYIPLCILLGLFVPIDKLFLSFVIAWTFLFVVTIIRYHIFPCPRCGKCFFTRLPWLYHNGFTRRCVHCKLPLYGTKGNAGPQPVSMAKELSRDRPSVSLLTKFALGLVICFIAVGAILFWMADPLYLKAPKDRELFTVFQDHRAAFEQLRQMATEDSISYFTESDLDARLTDTRRQQYKRLLSEIRPGLSVGRDYDGQTRFIFAGGGLSAIGPGWVKGIEYVPGSTDREGVVLENLDQPASLAWGDVYLLQIEPKWFVFFQKTD